MSRLLYVLFIFMFFCLSVLADSRESSGISAEWLDSAPHDVTVVETAQT